MIKKEDEKKLLFSVKYRENVTCMLVVLRINRSSGILPFGESFTCQYFSSQTKTRCRMNVRMTKERFGGSHHLPPSLSARRWEGGSGVLDSRTPSISVSAPPRRVNTVTREGANHLASTHVVEISVITVACRIKYMRPVTSSG